MSFVFSFTEFFIIFHVVMESIGGNRFERAGRKSTVSDTFIEVKTHLMSATKGCCMIMCIKDFYCSAPMDNYECVNFILDLIPDEIIR